MVEQVIPDAGKLVELAEVPMKPVFCWDCANKRTMAAIFGGKCSADFYQRLLGYSGFCKRYRARAQASFDTAKSEGEV